MAHVRILIFSAALLSSGCGTLRTVGSEPGEGVRIGYFGKNSYCATIPRIYSGLAYDYCVLNGPPRMTSVPAATGSAPPWPLLDFPLSLVADTLVLPYTIYSQSRYGNILVQRDSGRD